MTGTRGTATRTGTKRSAPIGNNLVRMIGLAEAVFDMHNDPDQIQVDARIIARLKRIHPASVSERSTRHGPTAWMLVFPTSRRLMELFIGKKISEREMLRRTRTGRVYDAVYLCSVLVLPEYRGKGLAQRLAVRSIKAIQQDHPITSLFYWPFSSGGEKLAEAVAHALHLPLYTRTH